MKYLFVVLIFISLTINSYLSSAYVLAGHFHIFFRKYLFRFFAILNSVNYFLAMLRACRVFIPWPETEPVPAAVEAQSPLHWTPGHSWSNCLVTAELYMSLYILIQICIRYILPIFYFPFCRLSFHFLDGIICSYSKHLWVTVSMSHKLNRI